MPYYTGTLTGGGAAALRVKVEELLAANSPVWTQVSLGTTGSYAWTLWENNGSHAWAGGRKWYLLLASDGATAGATLRIAVAEEYDVVSGLFGCTTRGAGAVTLDSAGRKSTYSGLASSTTFSSNLYLTNVSASATWTYWIVVTPEGVFVKHNNDNNQNYCYAGLLESTVAPLVPGTPTFDFPLCLYSYDRSQTDAYAVFTRLPGRTGSVSYPFSMLSEVLLPNGLGSLPTGLTTFGGKALLSRVHCYHGNSTAQNLSRGFLPDWLLSSGSLDVGVAVNDTITVNGATYRCMNSTQRMWLREVA